MESMQICCLFSIFEWFQHHNNLDQFRLVGKKFQTQLALIFFWMVFMPFRTSRTFHVTKFYPRTLLGLIPLKLHKTSWFMVNLFLIRCFLVIPNSIFFLLPYICGNLGQFIAFHLLIFWLNVLLQSFRVSSLLSVMNGFWQMLFSIKE